MPIRSLLAVFVLLLSACASTPKDFRLTSIEQQHVFPLPPDQPRYQFEGYLLGEENFIERQEQKLTFRKVVSWIVGLTLGEKDQNNFQRPQTGVLDESRQRLYVTDSGKQGVFVFDQQVGAFEFWQGVDEWQDFRTPIGIALDGQGNVFIADADLGQVFKLDQEGKLLDTLGEQTLKRPTGLCVNQKLQRLYVADSATHQILVFEMNGEFVKRIGRRGEADGEFNAPTHVACTDRKLLVSDTLNARVQVFDSAGGWLSTFGKRGMYVGDLPRPKGIAVDQSERIYVVESYYDYLLVYDDLGRPLLPIGGTGSKPGQFELPAGVWTDRSGRVFVADMLNHRVAVFRYIGDGTGSSAKEQNVVSGNENHKKAN